MHGKCNTIEESQAWFSHQLSKDDTIVYIVFAKTSASGNEVPYPGEVVGNVGLRKTGGPELPPFANTLQSDYQVPSSDHTSTEPTVPPPSDIAAKEEKPLNLRSIGYNYLRSAWGKGYATEAGKAVLEAYREGTKEERGKGEEVWYVEAIWNPGNPASGRILEKLGFKMIGYKEQEKLWLAGDWRYGYNVNGWYV